MSTIESAREELQGVLYELTHQMGGTQAVEDARDALYEALDLDSYDWSASSRIQSSAFPYYEIDRLALPHLKGDSMGRVYVRAENERAITATRWTKTKDLNTGLEIEMRRANCGAGCKCATEVRIIG